MNLEVVLALALSPLLNPEMVLAPVYNPLKNLVMASAPAHSLPLYPRKTLVTNPQIRETTQALATNLSIPFPQCVLIPRIPLVLETGRGGGDFKIEQLHPKNP
jgi:hypothetical protein